MPSPNTTKRKVALMAVNLEQELREKNQRIRELEAQLADAQDKSALNGLSVITVESSPVFIGFKRGKFFVDVVNEGRFVIEKTEHCILQDAINLAYEQYETLRQAIDNAKEANDGNDG